MKRSRVILFSLLALLVVAIAALALLDSQGRAKQSERDLGSILVFADPAQCRSGEPLTRIAQALRDLGDNFDAGRAQQSIVLPGFAEPQRLHRIRRFGVGRDAMGFVSQAELEIRGRWHGLSVIGLRSTSGTNPEIRFSDRPERVREILAGLGFPLPAVDQWQQPNYSAESPTPMTSVQSRSGGASLYCEPVQS